MFREIHPDRSSDAREHPAYGASVTIALAAASVSTIKYAVSVLASVRPLVGIVTSLIAPDASVVRSVSGP